MMRMNLHADETGRQFETVVMANNKMIHMVLDRAHGTVQLLEERDGAIVPTGRRVNPPYPFHIYADDRTVRARARPQSTTGVKVLMRSGAYLYFLVKRYGGMDTIRFLHQREDVVYTTDEELEPADGERWRILREDAALYPPEAGGGLARWLAGAGAGR